MCDYFAVYDFDCKGTKNPARYNNEREKFL